MLYHSNANLKELNLTSAELSVTSPITSTATPTAPAVQPEAQIFKHYCRYRSATHTCVADTATKAPFSMMLMNRYSPTIAIAINAHFDQNTPLQNKKKESIQRGSFYFFSGDNRGTSKPFGRYYYITSCDDLTAAVKRRHLLHSEVLSGDRQGD